MSESERIAADLNEAMPTLQEVQDAAMEPPASVALPPLQPASSPYLVDSRGPTPVQPSLPPLPPAPSPAEIVPAAGNGKSALPSDWERQLEPRSMAEAKQLAMDMFASRMFSQFGSAPAVLAVILSGREYGIPAMASLRGFDQIDGKPTLKADLIRGLILRSGKVDYFRCTHRSAEKATFVIKRKGDPEIELTHTLAESKQAWTKGDKAWENSGHARVPADMNIARASAKLARLVCPDVIHGLYAPEEFDV